MSQMRLSALLWAVGVLVSPARATCTRSILAFSGDTCATIASANGITVQQFVQWNGGLSSCTLTPGRSYCVADNGAQPTSQPTQAPGLVSSPDGTCGPGTNYKCDNPAFGLCCSAHGYCGDTTDHCGTGCDPTYGTCSGGGECTGGASTTTVFVTKTSTCPTAGGATRTVTSTTTATATITSTLTTTSVRTVTSAGPGATNTITVIRTVTVVNSVTVTAPGGTRTVTVTTTTTKGGSDPIPTWPGIIPTCRRFYQLQDGDTCSKVARQFGVTEREFKYWNPNLDCGYLQEAWGYNVCVGIPGSVLVEDPSNPST